MKLGTPTTLAACPVGLFLDNGELCLKTEYREPNGAITAYIVRSGEFYWGPHPQTVANQHDTTVTPVEIDDRTASTPAERAPEVRRNPEGPDCSDYTQKLAEELERLLADVTAGDLSTAERHSHDEWVECPACDGSGELEAADYCNFDGVALGVQFYGIGEHFGAHERLWTWFTKHRQTILSALRTTRSPSEAEECPSQEALSDKAEKWQKVFDAFCWVPDDQVTVEQNELIIDDQFGGKSYLEQVHLWEVQPGHGEAIREAICLLPELLNDVREDVCAFRRAALSHPSNKTVELLREALEACLSREQERAEVYGLSDCACIDFSRSSEREYETGTCPHQRGRAALAKLDAHLGEKA